MIKSSRTIALVLVGSAAAALTSAPLMFEHHSENGPETAGDFDGSVDSFAATRPSTRPAGSDPYYSSGTHTGSYYHHYYHLSSTGGGFFGAGSSDPGMGTGAGSGRTSSGAHSGTSRGGFGGTGHAAGS